MIHFWTRGKRQAKLTILRENVNRSGFVGNFGGIWLEKRLHLSQFSFDSPETEEKVA
jgi:hypothetical protein